VNDGDGEDDAAIDSDLKITLEWRIFKAGWCLGSPPKPAIAGISAWDGGSARLPVRQNVRILDVPQTSRRSEAFLFFV
jgi:hypothetical protein